ncbi:hypothetical protein ACFOZ0_22065 [Streptomyces yaanensis]|uniref:LigA protein n=1 Tax=Streptomyces yaanensis TaxID=1142239 RepID=A0ABV7SG22_9ACTN|nr:hypothetical protein [Streptomyces sp. CGMCC 4.7035]WNB97486.1 hypothetical protein Q2K21_05025 [Streptomyces sp. CGMCC 4.7035]
MPVEEHDPFEDRFAAALRHAGGAFETDQQSTMVARGETRGRRLRLWRRAAAVAGGVTGIALVGLGGALVLPGTHGDAEQQRSAAANPLPTASPTPTTTHRASPVTGDEVIRTLKSLLPKGKFSNETGRGTGEKPAAPYAQVVYDDGNGKAAVSLSVARVQPGSEEAREAIRCPDKVYIAYDACTTSTLPDGSKVMVMKGYEYPNQRSGTKRWVADLITPTGQHISAQEWNAAAEKDAPVSREQPPLSPAQLTALISAREWRAVADAVPAPPMDTEPSPTQLFPGGSVSSTLTSLLPKGVKVVDRSGAGDSGFGYVVVDDGKGRSLVQVNVQPNMSDVEGDLFGAGTKTLPDGTKVATHQEPSEKGGAGAVMWTVDTIRTDGRRVVISALNAGAPHDDATRETPALTMKQMEAIATSAKWLPAG